MTDGDELYRIYLAAYANAGQLNSSLFDRGDELGVLASAALGTKDGKNTVEPSRLSVFLEELAYLLEEDEMIDEAIEEDEEEPAEPSVEAEPPPKEAPLA